MSFEHMPSIKNAVFHEARTEQETEAAIEDLLSEFPEEIQEKLEEKITDMSLDGQVAYLEKGLKKRRETLLAPKHRSDNLTMIGRVPGSIFEHAYDHKDAVEVGRGENGRVFEYKVQEGAGVTIVYKMLLRHVSDFHNDLMTEAAYQSDVAKFAEEQADTRIGVPHALFVAQSLKGLVLAMDKVPGYSIKDVVAKNVKLPRDYDFDALEKGLKTFILRMNEAGFYHRDIREGNIMVDPAPASEMAPLGYVIDFGLCTKAGSHEEAYATVDGTRDHVTMGTVVEQLKAHQKRVWQETNKHE